MPRKATSVIRALVHIPRERALVAELRARSRQVLQRIARQTVQRLSTRWPSWVRLLNPRQRQIVTATRPQEPRPAQPASPVNRAALLRDLQSTDWTVRARAASRLENDASDQAIDGLVTALRDPSAEVALAAIDSLARQSGPRVATALRDVFANADGFFSPLTRAAALAALAERLPGNEFKVVFDAIHDVDSEVSLAAIGALQRSKPEAATEKLVAVLRDESGYFLPPVREAAAYALRKIGNLPEGQRATLLETESDPAVRRALGASLASAAS